MTTVNEGKKHDAPLPPLRFAFGGGPKPLSELAFNKHDKDKNGSISRNELRSLCYDLGYYLSNDELAWAWTVLDKDGNGMIDRREFVEWWKTSSRFEHLKILNEKQTALLWRLVEICRSHDIYNTGTLDRTQFTAVCQELVQENILNATKHQAYGFDEIDRDHDGQINFNELVAWFKNIGLI